MLRLFVALYVELILSSHARRPTFDIYNNNFLLVPRQRGVDAGSNTTIIDNTHAMAIQCEK